MLAVASSPEPPSLARRLVLAPRLEFAVFRSQETVQILLNLVVLTALMSLHVVFRPVVGRLSSAAAIAFGLRFAMQVGEAALLNDPRRALGPRGTWWYARLSILANVAFTAILARLASGQESHYAVLMVIPVIAAALRLSPLGLVACLAAVIALTIGQVWIPAGHATPATTITEAFEATTVSLIFVVVAAVVRLVADLLWAREAELRRSLDALAAARDRLVREENLAAVGRLASAIAHEIRNPVSMIASAVGTVRRPDAPPDLRAEVLDILGQESKRLERLTEDFLAYARQRPPQLRVSSLAEALDLVAGLVRARAGELGVSVVVDVEDTATRVDPFQIQQALLNLAMNGLDATPPGGTLTLSARLRGGEGVFGVENTGPALPPEVVARLGEPFFTTKPRGTGLGIAIARAIARAHGGDLSLAENAPGRVRFELGVAAAGEAAA